MSDPLGRGLESLIPERVPEDVPADLAAPEAEVQPPPPGRPAGEPAGSQAPENRVVSGQAVGNAPPAPLATTDAPARRHYEDHFQPKRDDSVFWIEIDKIDPNPFQPRREFNEETLRELAASIREHGVLQPILVTKREFEAPTGISVRYQLIAGERRWRAARLAGLSQIPAMIRRGVPDERIRLELALIENIQREDLNAIERARAYKRLIDEFNLVQREISMRLGKSREAIANTMRLLTLAPEIQEVVLQNKISEGHARAILMVGEDPIMQMRIFNEVLEERMSVRAAENRARQLTGRALVPRRRPSRATDPELRMWESQLQDLLGTKVQLQKMGERGKIVVEFYSDEELRSLISKFIQQS